jgi:hypothetical protein
MFCHVVDRFFWLTTSVGFQVRRKTFFVSVPLPYLSAILSAPVRRDVCQVFICFSDQVTVVEVVDV